MNKLLVILLCSCFLFEGCAKRNDLQPKKVERFPLEKKLELKAYKVEPALFFVSDMVILNNKLVTLDVKNNVFFQLFNLPDLKYVGSQIHKGEGPTEETFIFPYIENVGKESFAYRNMNKIKVVSYDSIENKFLPHKSYQVPQETEILNYCLLNNSICGYDMLRNTGREFIRYDFDTRKIQDFGPSFPSVSFSVSDDKKNVLFTKIMASKVDDTRFAALYDKFPLLRIYDNEGNLMSETEYINHQQLPIGYTNKNMSMSDIENTTKNYMRIKTTRKYIYGLYSGKTNKDLSDSGGDGTSCCCEIHLWDWDGNPVARLMLNKNVTCFAVSQDDSYIVLYSSLDEGTLYKTDIPTLKDSQ